jgi:hypothetical protein
MGNTDIIIVRRYWEFKHRASSLNSRVCLIVMVVDDSI